MASTGKHVLFLVENASVPNDMRVWKEAKAVHEMGFRVTVLCPRGSHVDREPSVVREGIRILRYRPLIIGSGFLSYFVEYFHALLVCSWHIFTINLRDRIHVFHVGNPPDIFFVPIVFYTVFGARYIFDMHDLFVKTFESKYQSKNSVLKSGLVRLLRLVEGLNCRAAQLVIATNQSYQDYILRVHRRDPADVFVVRNAPPLDHRERIPPHHSLKRGKEHLLVYFGIMGEDDGVDIILRAMDYLVNVRGRTDIHCALIGPTQIEASPAIRDLMQLHAELKLTSSVEFTGYLSWEDVHVYLNTADVGLSPDPFTSQNDLSTMQKIMEYMSHGLPIVSFNLKENRYSAGDAAVYCESFTPEEFGNVVLRILESPEVRARMSVAGRERYRSSFNWSNSVKILEEVYQRV